MTFLQQLEDKSLKELGGLALRSSGFISLA